jgi:hypothetical protein
MGFSAQPSPAGRTTTMISGAGQVLVLDVDVLPGRGNQVEIQPPHFGNGRLAIGFSEGTRDSDVDVGERGLQLLRPRVQTRAWLWQRRARRAQPSLIDKAIQRPGCRVVYG